MFLLIAILMLCFALIITDRENFESNNVSSGVSSNIKESNKAEIIPPYANPRMSLSAPGGLASAIAAPGPAPEILIIDNWAAVTR
jgi:hypothetical protein